MSDQGALGGLRVVDLTTDIGRFATKLLAEAGASVVMLSRGQAPGKPMNDAQAAARGGLANWWFDGGKQPVSLDLEAAVGRLALRELCTHADLVIDDETPGELERLGLDFGALSEHNPSLVQVSLTPFGSTGPRSGWQATDLVAAAMGGVLSLTGEPDHPMNTWGRQNYNFGGFMAALSGLAAVYSVRAGGPGQHVDVSLQEVVASSIENLFFQYWYDDLLPLPKIAPRQGALHWYGAYDVVPAATGAVMVTPTPLPDLLFEWMVEDGMDEASEFLGLAVEEVLPRISEVMDLTARFALRHDADYLGKEAQRRHIAFGEVQSPVTVAKNPQFEHRGFFEAVDWSGPEIRRPARLARMLGTPQPPLAPPPAEASALEEILSDWSSRDRPMHVGDRNPATKPLDGVRVVDFTWVLAGPFCTRMLGDLGAEVLKIQNEARATLVNRADYPYYPVWNRSKKSVMLDMKHPEALEAIRKLIENADVLVENYSAGVLDRWGLSYETVSSWNPRLIYMTMSGCGHDGPWSDVISYAPTVHALCGLTYLSNPAGRHDVGPGFSLNDHAAGFAAATSIVEALLARAETGRGQLIDMAQLEVGSYLIGPALLDHFANDAAPEPDGNADCFVDMVPSETYGCADGGWVAISARDDADWQRLCVAIGRDDLAADQQLASVPGRLGRRGEVDEALLDWTRQRTAEQAMVMLQEAGVPAGKVQNAASLSDDPQLIERGFWREFVDHPHFGTRPFDRFPAIFSASGVLDPYLRSPYFGEHNFEIYGDVANMSEEEIAVGIATGLFE